jgi:hypothetical protein
MNKKYSLHMKGKILISEMEKYFDFSKLDIFGKKKCPKKNSLDIL